MKRDLLHTLAVIFCCDRVTRLNHSARQEVMGGLVFGIANERRERFVPT